MVIFGAMFHHFHDGEKHIQGQGSLDAETFRRLLLALQQRYRILEPQVYRERIQQQCLAADEICLTFDDALKCQVDIALPVLQELDLNAFFFVYSEAFSGTPDHLEVFRDFRHRQFADMEAFYVAFFARFCASHPEKHADYLYNYPADYLQAFPFYTEMDRRFRYVRDNIIDSDQYDALMFELMADHHYCIEEHSGNLFMCEADLATLLVAGNCIGLHSNSHPTTMDKWSSEAQWREYSGNKAFIEKIVGEPVWAMSHPCGRYNEETLQILRDLNIELGFRSSLSVREIRSPLEVPREDHSNLVKALL